MPDHGELWAMAWTSRVGVDDQRAWLELAAQGPITGTKVVKRLGLADASAPDGELSNQIVHSRPGRD